MLIWRLVICANNQANFSTRGQQRCGVWQGGGLCWLLLLLRLLQPLLYENLLVLVQQLLLLQWVLIVLQGRGGGTLT